VSAPSAFPRRYAEDHMAPRKAEVLALGSLGRSIDSAVKLAASRYQLTVDSNTILDRWEIIGRRIRGAVDMNTAYSFATDVARGVGAKVPGLSVQPIVSRIGRDTWVGFIERGRLPKSLPR
jgi:hypothetical protein